jgi:dihydroorotate dehydrogenase
MFFLQVDTTKVIDEVSRYYDAGGGNILGLLLGSLAVAVSVMASAIVALWWRSNKREAALTDLMATKSSEYMAKLVELNVSCVSTLNDLSDNLEALRDAGVNMTDKLRSEIDRTREHIASKVDNLAEKIKQ